MFDVPEDANTMLGVKNPSSIVRKDAFGVHDLNWQPNLAEMFVDMTDWTDDKGRNAEPGQGSGVRPDSTTVEAVDETRADVPTHQDTTSPVDEGPPKFPSPVKPADVVDVESLDDISYR